MGNGASVQSTLNDLVIQHMRTDVARLRIEQTIGDALESIQANPPANRIIYFYVVDADGKLQGVVPTRRLLLNPRERLITDIMVREMVTIPSSATVLDACEFFVLHRLLAFPVVDAEGCIIGVVDVELYTDELSDFDKREESDQLFQLIGVRLSESQQLNSVVAFRSRFPWLVANITGGIVAAFISGVFEAELQRAVALAMFIPVVLALAESVSIQSVSLALQVTRGTTPTLPEFLRKLRSEFQTGVMLGLASALAVGAVGLLWLGQWPVVSCLVGGIVGGVTCAAMLGMAMPNIIRFFHREPQVAAGPLALAATDMVTLLIYFSLARMLV